MHRAAGADRHRADLRATRRVEAPEVSLRSLVHPPPIAAARHLPDPAVVLDHDAWDVGSAREKILTAKAPIDAAIREGHYAAKQIFCKDRLVAWSHPRPVDVGVQLARRVRGQRILDYGCGGGTLLALPWATVDRPASAVGAALAPVQMDRCRDRFH